MTAEAEQEVPVLGWQLIEQVISNEVRRIQIARRVPGYETEDLLQEGRLVAVKAFKQPTRVGPLTRKYLQSSVRNALVNIKRNAFVGRRNPGTLGCSVVSFDSAFEGWRGGWVSASIEMDDAASVLAAPSTGEDPEGLLDALRLARRYRVYEKQMSYSYLFPPSAEAPAHLPVVGSADFPTCHADSPTPDGTGFDARDAGCHTGCSVKFTCLPRAVALGMIPGPVGSVDREVEAVIEGDVTYAFAIARMATRAAIKGTIPDGLYPTDRLVQKKNGEAKLLATAAPLAQAAPRAQEPAADVQLPAPRSRRRRKAPRTTPPKPRVGGTYSAERLPKEGTLPEAVMAKRLAEATSFLRMPRGRSLEVGHVIRKSRDSQERPAVEVRVLPNGFGYDGRVYPSLSAVAMAAVLPYSTAVRRNISGAVFFSVAANKSVEILDQHGTVIAKKF